MATESLELSGIRPPNFPRLRPVNNITPFTYQDGTTYLEILNAMERYIKSDLVPDIDKNNTAFVEKLNTFISDLEAGLTVDREAMAAMYQGFTDLVSAEVALINNKTGAVDVQQITLTGPREITVDPLWPDNQPVEFVIRQDGTGGHVITYAPNITGAVELNTAPNSVTRFTLIPDGTGNWFTVQTTDSLEKLDQRLDQLVGGIVDPRFETINRSITEGDNSLSQKIDAGLSAAAESVSAANGRIDKANETAKENGYVFANFVANGVAGEHLNLFYSPDGKTLFGGNDNPVYIPADAGGLRDPSIIYRNNKWYVVYTSKDGQNKDFAIAHSITGAAGTWSLLTKINVASISTLNKSWAPEFIEDGNDLYIFFTSITSGNQGSMYWMKSLNSELTAWTSPVPMNWTTGPVGTYIDGVPVKNKDGKWYIFYSNGGSIGRGVATSLNGPWTVDKSGNWAGWGTGIEGPTIVRDGDIFRAYFDRYVENTGLHWSEAPDLSGPWTSPIQVATAPYTLSAGERLRHGSVRKLETPAERNKILAALTMPLVGGMHTEFSNGQGSVIGKSIWSVLQDNAIDENETTNKARVTYDPATQNFKLNELCVYSISAAINLVNNGASTITNVTRGVGQMVQPENVNVVHGSGNGGVEDKFMVIVPNFKPRYAGEEVKFRLLAEWVGGASAKLQTRIRFTKIANI